ncbi:MAG: GDP-mannose 4,6-dehydratase [Candidatus Rokubacteria bacterium]|nr:GDP-mannose 4,6-dehydratase [Candidatus Rokubacteria bacterium]
MTRVFVTGVAGMIGSHLLDELLARGYDVVGIDNLSFGTLENISHNLSNPWFWFYQVDILDFERMNALAEGADVIVHLAAIKKTGEREPSIGTLRVNGKGTEHIFEAARIHGCKVIYASTSDVYGMSPDLPLREGGDLLIGPSMIKRWSYAVSKLYGEQIAYAYYKDYRVPMVILRYFGGFSPRSSFTWSGGHIPLFVDAILHNREVIIHGDGTQTRSMAYVTDLVEGTMLAMENEAAVGEIFNIGNDEELSVIETAYLIKKIANIEGALKLRFVPFEEVFGRYKDIMRRIPDLTKAKQILNYHPKVSLEDSIRLMIEAVQNKHRSD